MSTASWISLPNLGSFITNYDFNLNPIILLYTCDPGASINVLNGSLPNGLTWNIINGTIEIQGESNAVTAVTNYEITFRIKDPDGTIADRSFYISITPIAITPQWTSQNTFLGYATLGKTSNYTVTATVNSTIPISYSLINAPSNMSIDSQSGIITFIPSLLLQNGSTPYYNNVQFKIRASANNITNDLSVNIIVLSSNYAPQWITPPGSIGMFIMNSFVEFDLMAYEPSGNTLSYVITSSDSNFPFTLSNTGFLYGRVPTTNSNHSYAFTVTATGDTGSTSQQFIVNAIIDTVNSVLSWNNNEYILGPYADGQITDIDVSASTTRSGYSVYHSFSGGTLPLNMTLNMQQGHISGFLEYHPYPKTYYFEITATDGIQTIVRKYEVSVIRGTYDMFVNVSIPIMSDIKQAVASTKQSMIHSASDVPYHATLTDNLPIEMNLISGLSYTDANSDVIFNTSNLYLHSTILEFGSSAYSNINSIGDTLFYRNIIDPEFQAQFQPNNAGYYAESLSNMRQSLSQNNFVNNGNGNGAILIPNIDPETGGIESVTQTNSGSNYYYSPTLFVNGSGNGAILSSNITVNSANVINSSSGWQNNQIFDLIIDENNTITMKTVSVDATGKIVSIEILNGGSFNAFPYGYKTIFNNNNNAEVSFNLCINSVNVVNSGSGYSSNSTISTNGQEILPSWQKVWFPYIPICTVNYSAVYNTNSMVNSSTLSILDALDWKIRFLTFDIEGKRWTGNTIYDKMNTSFDGDQTRFVEWLEPINVTFDSDNTTFDYQGTDFDMNPKFQSSIYKMYGDTIIDNEITIFDLYQTVLDEYGPSFKSITQIRKLYRLLNQTINSNNLLF